MGIRDWAQSPIPNPHPHKYLFFLILFIIIKNKFNLNNNYSKKTIEMIYIINSKMFNHIKNVKSNFRWYNKPEF